MPVNPACAVLDAFGVRIGNSYTGRTRIGRVPIGSSVVLGASTITHVDGVAVTPGATYTWFEEPDNRKLIVIQEVDPLDTTLKNTVYLDWVIDLLLVPDLASIFQVSHNLNGVVITHCVHMPDAPEPQLPDLLRLEEVAGNTAFFVPASKGACPLVANPALSSPSEGTDNSWRGMAWMPLEGTAGEIAWLRHTTSNGTELDTSETDGTNRTNRATITFGSGVNPSQLKYDVSAGILIAKHGIIVTITVPGYTPTHLSSLTTDAGGEALAIDGTNIYWSHGSANRIFRATYAGADETEVVSNADILAGGVTDSNIVAMDFDGTLLHCLNTTGEYFTANPATGLCVLKVAATQWDNIGSTLNIFSDILHDPEEGVVYCLGGFNTTADAIWRATIGDELNNEECLAFPSAGNQSGNIIHFTDPTP